MDRLQLYLYSGIGDWDGSNAESVVKQLLGYRQADGVDVYINSLGGDVFEGMAIYNVLVRSGLDVVTHVDGAALSIASVIAQAGRERRMARGGLMMIHEPAWWMGYATIQEVEKLSQPLTALRESISDVYAARTGQTAASWLTRMTAETWYTAEQAVAAGLADTVVDVDASGRLVITADGSGAQPVPSQALNTARELHAARADGSPKGQPAADRPAVHVAARLVTPSARPLVVNNAGIPASPAPPTSQTAVRRATMKFKDLLAKFSGDLDADVEIDTPATPTEPAAPAPEAAPQNAAAAPATDPANPATPADPATAINALTTTVNSLAETVKSLQSEKAVSARNAFDTLLDQKVKAFAVNEADRSKWTERFEKLGAEVAMQLLQEVPEGARRPGRVTAPQNRSTAMASEATMSFKDYFTQRNA